MLCALPMTACASVSPAALPASLTTCRAPAPYPAEPGIADLVEALNDTYLAWEECHATVEMMRGLYAD
jgi:hypothetical protein